MDLTLEGIEPEEAVEYIGLAPDGTYAAYMRADGDEVEIEWNYIQRRPFERIRRITGYLVGTMDRWNDAKRAEEHDRVKHEVRL